MPLSVSSAVRQLSDGNTAGTILGRSSTDLIGFYGLAQGVVQPSGNAQAALTRGQTGGIIATAGSTNTPTSIPVQATSEVTLALNTKLSQVGTGFSFGLALTTTDMVFVNKPTQQAGLAVASSRVLNATQVGVTFANFTAATISATAGETYGFVAIRGIPATTVTITPAVVSAATTNEQTFTVPGIRVGDAVALNPPANVTNVCVGNVRVAGNNSVAVTFVNTSPTTATTPPAGAYTFFSTGGIDGAANVFAVQSHLGTIPGPSGSTTSSFSYSVTGLAVTDQILAISKPTQQAGIGFTQGFVAAANVIGVGYTNFGPTVTPTNNEIYGLGIWRPQPAAPCIIYTPALTPASIGANTTTSQAFTVTGLINSSMVFVNKPTSQVGLTIMGARVSGTNQLEITFANATGATITPTAGETYTVANFQQAVPNAGDTFLFQATPAMQANSVLSNAIRSALLTTGLVAGA